MFIKVQSTLKLIKYFQLQDKSQVNINALVLVRYHFCCDIVVTETCIDCSQGKKKYLCDWLLHIFFKEMFSMFSKVLDQSEVKL